MSTVSQRLKWFYRFLASRELSLILFLLLCAVLIPGTFGEREDIEIGWPGRIILGIMSLNLILCTLQRLKTLSKAVLVMHFGTIMVIAGTVVSSFGFVATVNIYEGTSVNKAYRWDVKKDMPLGFDFAINKIHVEYYPIPVRVGVLRGAEKVGLFELKTTEHFNLDGYTVKAELMEFPAETLKLSVAADGQYLGAADTSGMKSLPADFPFDFVLVAFQNPHLKRVWLDVSLSKDSQLIAEGKSEINSPLTWGKYSFYNVNIDFDEFGNKFAGIQITNDPGRPYVYAGFTVIGLGSVMYLLRRFSKSR